MSCNEYIEMISSEIDGELEENRALFLMRHLAVCDGCRGEYRGNLRLRDMILEDRAACQMDVSAGFSGSVINIIEREMASEVAVPAQRVKQAAIPAGGFFSKLKDFHFFPKPALTWSFAVSLVLLVSITAIYDSSTQAPTSKIRLMDAKMLKPQILKIDHAVSGEENEMGEMGDVGYYITRHTEAVSGMPINRPVANIGAGLVHVAYNIP